MTASWNRRPVQEQLPTDQLWGRNRQYRSEAKSLVVALLEQCIWSTRATDSEPGYFGRNVPCQRSQQSMSSESWSLWRCCNGATEHILHISIPCGNQQFSINLHSLIVLLQHMTYVARWNYSAEFCSGACFISGSMVITGYSLLLMESSEGTRFGSLELKQKTTPNRNLGIITLLSDIVMAPTGSASSPHHFVCTLLLCLQWWKRTTSTDTLNLTGKS